jgi:DNA-directed RNA polymerase subunit beta
MVSNALSRVEGNKVSDTIDYLSAIEESHSLIAQANAEMDAKHPVFTDDLISSVIVNSP